MDRNPKPTPNHRAKWEMASGTKENWMEKANREVTE